MVILWVNLPPPASVSETLLIVLKDLARLSLILPTEVRTSAEESRTRLGCRRTDGPVVAHEQLFEIPFAVRNVRDAHPPQPVGTDLKAHDRTSAGEDGSLARHAS